MTEILKSRNYKCELCGNTKIEELNIEGMIHHQSIIKCFDSKKCKRRQRKYKKENNV